MTDILVGRQQILDCDLKIYAYEILFRGTDFDLNLKDGATSATNQVITDSILEIGLNGIVGSGKAFINFTAQNLLEKTPLHLPKDRIVIEVLEDVTVDFRIINHLREFSQQGYTIALDDFVYTPEWVPLIEFADIIKLDIMAMPLSETLATIEKLKAYDVKLLAEKVETREAFEVLKKAGCVLFQGFFFSKPNIVAGKRLGVNQIATIKLLSTINNPEVSFNELSTVITQDVGLSYKLLHYINSAFFSFPNKIESIHHGVTCLGISEIKRWVNILTLTSVTNKPDALFQNILIRGKMCELLAEQFDQDPSQMFLMGMLSSLDSLLDIPLEEAISQLPMSEGIERAILHKEGVAGEILSYVINYEQWKLTDEDMSRIKPITIGEIYFKSVNWSNETLGCK
ncbi:MAG: HDOD domain-containing protein [Methylococcales bacterium]|nr:HDOD domain-containing protein [Methylococcales bacterium]